MKPATTLISAALIAIIASYATVHLTSPEASTTPAVKAETLLDKISKTNTIRCGYFVASPYFIKDSNTGKMSGIFHDLTEKMGQLLNVKIEWAYETTIATYVEDMKAGRYDVYCSGLWPEASRSRYTQFTIPVNYAAMGLYVRGDDNRFDNSIELLNNKDYRFATLDGEMAAIVAKEDFPNAQVSSHPHNSEISILITDVITHKADAVVIDKSVAEAYIQQNPGSLKNLTAERPIRIFANTWATLHGNEAVINMMNIALSEMVNTGAVDKILSTYDPGMTNFYPLAKPYEAGNR